MSYPPRDKFQVGWICALPEEAAAAGEMLDEKFGTLKEQDSSDTNSYTLGRIGKHFVAIAVLGQYGTTSATAVATNMSRTFSRSLRIGLMVGIAAGIPSSGHDIRLGDIVVSCPGGTCGGVVQYDIGKLGKDGKLMRTGSLNAPPRSLLTAVATMRAVNMTEDPKYLAYMEKAIHRNERTRKTFGRPDVSTDRLFRADCEHPVTASTCDGCLPEWEQPRIARKDDEAKIYYGTVASGNAVIKHAATRDQLGRETGALCFEMEAAGLMMDFPCIVVRGICDYADSHKNDKWHGYAALAAAAYAKELLDYVPSADLDTEKLVIEVCQIMSGQIQEVNRGLELAFRQREEQHHENIGRALAQELQDCHQAFKTSTYEAYKNVNPKREEGTCRWVLDNVLYHHWRGSDRHDLLWITADPGCGKSVLARSLADRDLVTSSPISICYFFFKDNEYQDSLATALCALLHQLFGLQPQLLRNALPEWRKNGTQIKEEIDALWRILDAVVLDEAFTSTIFILDALDECQTDHQGLLVQKLVHFYTEKHSVTRQNWLKFLLTSRPYANIQNGFRSATESFPEIRIRGEDENEQIHKEINFIVKIRVEQLAQEFDLAWETRQKLEEQLLRMRHRTYLWLHLAMEEIRTMLRISWEPEKLIQNLAKLIPDSVDAAYEKILQRVPRDARRLVKSTFQIIISAWRPLTIPELAIALGAAMADWRRAASAGLEPRGLAENIRQLCGLFVFIDSSERVYLMHQTAREFLVKNVTPDGREWPAQIGATHRYEDVKGKPRLLEVTSKVRRWYHTTRAQANFLMLRICLTYLSADELENGSLIAYRANNYGPWKKRTAKELRAYEVLHPFFEYSWRQWANHAIAIYPVKMDALLDLVIHTRVAPALRDYWLICVSHFELIKTTQMLVENGADLETRFCSGSTPLGYALMRNGRDTIKNESMVRLLVGMGANIEAPSSSTSDTTPLMGAVYWNNKALARLLVELGANLQASHVVSKTPLIIAARGGQEDMARLLISLGAHVDGRDVCGMTPLMWAIAERKEDMTKLLLRLGADVEARDAFDRKTALSWAIQSEQEGIAELLLDHGAHIKIEDSLWNTPVMRAIAGKRKDVAELLLQRGANLGMRNSFGEARLLRAFETGNQAMARTPVLMNSGAAQAGIVGRPSPPPADWRLQRDSAKWFQQVDNSVSGGPVSKRRRKETFPYEIRLDIR
ncbi:hypothetical protein TgHK011_008302 [Trichoderma gracile]|nr:hypothetical protein TgHK011_008302 [Trichoderma gracile]